MDRFRQWVLEKCKENPEIDSLERLKINEELAGYIESYIEMETYLKSLGDWSEQDSPGATYRWYLKPVKETSRQSRKVTTPTLRSLSIRFPESESEM